MLVMFYFMADVAIRKKACQRKDTGSGNGLFNGSTSVPPDVTHEPCDYETYMLTAGLSLENLLMFLLCTPCQVLLLSIFFFEQLSYQLVLIKHLGHFYCLNRD